MPAPKEKQTFYSLPIAGEWHSITGRKRTPKGYVTLCIKTHPHGDVHGYVFEHRVVMEMKIGRYMYAGEVIHHKNGIKHDNRLENLEVMTNGEHVTHHNTGRVLSEETKNKIGAARRGKYTRENSPSWIGGIRKYESGIDIYNPDHHRSRKNGYVFEHIIEAEKMLGRRLEKGEVVLHKDGDKHNNIHSNLEVVTENEMKRRTGLKARKGVYKNCIVCGTEFYRKPYGAAKAKCCSRSCAAKSKYLEVTE